MRQIAISKFADVEFCGLKPVYNFIEERRPRFRPCVFIGARQHAVSAGEDAEKEYETISAEELLRRLRDEGSVLEFPNEAVSVRFEFGGMGFSGRLDKLLKFGRSVVVCDEKFTSRAGGVFAKKYECQLSAYCNGLANGVMKVRGRALGEGVLRGFDLYYRLLERDLVGRHLVGKGEPKPFSEPFVASRLEKFAGILEGRFERRELACGEPAKCAVCEYRDGCEFSC